MTANRDTLGRSKVEIFRRFASMGPLGVVPESIEKRAPPEPDILCQTGAHGRVAFEMVEIIDQDLARQFTSQLELQRRLGETYQALPERARSPLAVRICNALVHVRFAHDGSIGARRRVIPSILEFLRTLPPGFEGECNPRLYGVDSIRILRGGFNGPCFDVDAGGALGNPTIARLQRKFEKTYRTVEPIELLAHYELHPMPPDECWLPGAEEFVAERLARSPFRRVWIYDADGNVIKFVHP